MKKLIYILLVNLVLLTGYTISEVMTQFYIRCYVEAMSSDPMGSTDLSQYEPQATKHVDVLVIEYTDTDWNGYYTKSFNAAKTDWQNAINNLNTVFASANIEFSLADGDYRRKTIQTGASDLEYLFTDCSIDPLNDIKNYPDNYLRIASMPLDVKVTYNSVDYTVAGSVDEIFGSCIYVERNALVYDLQYYVAQSLGLYDTDETHFGTDVRDFLEDTETNQPNNLMNRQNTGTGLTSNQIQRLNWALETQPDLKKLIEIDIEFANKIGSQTVPGFLFYDNNTVPSGETEQLLDSKQYEIGTQDQFITYNSKDHQHYQWNDKAEDYIIKRDLRINKKELSGNDQLAKFAPLETVNIDLPSEADFFLRDPWFIQGGVQPNNFREITGNSFDAMLNQNEFFNSQYPIYEVQQPTSHQRNVHNENLTYYFREWSGTDVDFQNVLNNQTKVVFEETGATIQAQYKGHLASNHSYATGYNNGRRIVVDTQGKYHMVYEDNGRIWYTYSTNDGSTWQKEIIISDYYENCKYPSIAIGSGNKYHVVWQGSSPLFDGVCYFKEGQSNIIGIDDVSPTSNAYPVIAANYMNDFVMVVWNDGTNLKYKAYTDDAEWSAIQSVPNTNSSCIYPTLANDGSSSYATHLAWEKYNEIYYQNMNYFVDEEEEEYFFSWRHYKHISDISTLDENRYPSIAVRRADRKPIIVWQACSDGNDEIDQSIFYRKKSSTSSSSWGTVSEFYTDRENFQPAVTTYLNSDYNDATIVWRIDDNNGIMKVNKQNGSWSTITQIATSGRHPNISVYPNNISTTPSFDNLILYSKYNSTPYLIKNTAAGLGGQSKTSSILASDSRTEFYPLYLFSLEKVENPVNYGSFSFSLKAPSLSFPQINDTLLYEPFFKSNVIASDKLEFSYSVNPEQLNVKALQKASKDFAPYLLKIVLKENVSDKVVEEVRTVTLQDLLDIAASKESAFEESLSIDVSGYKSYDVYLDVLSNIQQTEEYIPQRIVSYKGKSSLELSKEFASKEKPAEIISSFKLYANYPNPFNPVTTITYDLPEGCRVNVSVYDVNGKKLADLENSFKEAGKHYAHFDGSKLSSGIYFYRINAGNYSSVKRMLLMK